MLRYRYFIGLCIRHYGVGMDTLHCMHGRCFGGRIIQYGHRNINKFGVATISRTGQNYQRPCFGCRIDSRHLFGRRWTYYLCTSFYSMARSITYHILFVFLFFVACNPSPKEKDKTPKTVVSEIYDQELFADILFDLTMVEAAYRLNMTDEEAIRERNVIYQNVLKAYGTDSTTFDENWTYYGYRPEEMQEVYNLVVEKIDEKRIERGAQPIKKFEDE